MVKEQRFSALKNDSKNVFINIKFMFLKIKFKSYYTFYKLKYLYF